MSAPERGAGLVTDALVVTLNGEPRRVDARATLAQLLDALGLAPDDCATAVNGIFVARDARAVHRLQPGDAVTCFQPIVGG